MCVRLSAPHLPCSVFPEGERAAVELLDPGGLGLTRLRFPLLFYLWGPSILFMTPRACVPNREASRKNALDAKLSLPPLTIVKGRVLMPLACSGGGGSSRRRDG
jgi:hypothetical protein